MLRSLRIRRSDWSTKAGVNSLLFVVHTFWQRFQELVIQPTLQARFLEIIVIPSKPAAIVKTFGSIDRTKPYSRRSLNTNRPLTIPISSKIALKKGSRICCWQAFKPNIQPGSDVPIDQPVSSQVIGYPDMSIPAIVDRTHSQHSPAHNQSFNHCLEVTW